MDAVRAVSDGFVLSSGAQHVMYEWRTSGASMYPVCSRGVAIDSADRLRPNSNTNTPHIHTRTRKTSVLFFALLLLLLLRCVLVAALAPILTERSRTSSSLLADKLPPSPWYLS